VLKAPAPWTVVEMWPEVLQICSCEGGDRRAIPCEERMILQMRIERMLGSVQGVRVRCR
jgi:hypothetical protein